MGQHLALYRKYRPKGFEALIGQNHIKRTLLNALNKGVVSHAYVFSGPRGTGKTSSAKLFAKAISCSHSNQGEPCGKCEVCKDNNPDIIEIDAASNNGVDEIRDIREKVTYSPVYGKYKVYIIDEVHMLTTGAFNALLKTLEEPPSHAIFILATTEPHKIPLTILSRCQRYDFRRISQSDIVSRMQFILEAEKKEAEVEALELIAQVASGGMRDALSLLDQCLSHAEGKVTLSAVLELTGAVDSREIGKMIRLIDSGDTVETLKHFNKNFQDGKEAKFFIEELLLYYRDILMYQKLGDAAVLKKSITDPDFNKISDIDPDKIYSNISLLNAAQQELKFQQDSQLVVEMALIKLTHNDEELDLKKEVESLKNEVKTLRSGINLLERKFKKGQSLTTENGQLEESKEEIFTSQQDLLKESVLPELVVEEEDESVKAAVSVQEEEDPIETDTVLEDQPEIETSIVEESPKTEEDSGFTLDFNDLVNMVNTTKVDTEEQTLVKEEVAVTQEEVVEDASKQEPEDKKNFESLVEEEINKPNSDWVELSEGKGGIPTVSMDELTLEEPPPENENGLQEEQPASSIGLTENERKVFDLLSDATKGYKEEYLGSYEEILKVLKKTKLSTYSLFREFKCRAVTNKHLIVSHEDAVKVKLIQKVTNLSIIQSVLDDSYKLLKIAVITDSEWKNIKEYFQQKN
jgi:DNA polymerase III subunit gamma/tau